MKVRPYERSALWRSAFSKRRNDPDERDREALAEAYRQLRDRAGILVGEIHAALPQLTVHDLTHADTLWDVASEICGPNFELNPLEGFVLGASFLLHDAGMALAAYKGGINELRNSVEWRDALVSAWKRRGVEDPSDGQRISPDTQVSDEATFQVLRERHASQARTLASALWTQPSTGRPLALVQNDDLLESYGLLVGNIAASHHWPLPEIGRFFGDSTPASAAWPRDWDVDSLLLACILRCSDACAIDETRAPSFLFAIRQPTGISKRHWNFQNKIYPAKRRDDSLVFESKSEFPPEESEDWWLCFDAIDVANKELTGSDALLVDRRRRPLLVRRVAGAGDPDILSRSVKVLGWRPVNTLPRISNPASVIERLGGKQLYGDNPAVPVRELIQNALDAIRARRFVDSRFSAKDSECYSGKILIEIAEIKGTGECWIAIEDNGVGMSEQTITRSLLDFGTSFWSSPAAAQMYPGLPSERRFKPVGRFGIGFFSVFMYSDNVIVASREFSAANSAWNVLSFASGIRGRGNLSVESTPDDVTSSEVSTRIKIRVKRDFLTGFASRYNFFQTDEEDEYRGVLSGLQVLVCAADVPIYLRYFGQELLRINDPLIYSKGAAAIWDAVVFPLVGHGPFAAEAESLESNQKGLFCFLGDEQDPYGFCGVSIGQFPNLLIKSVGGIGSSAFFGQTEPIAGIAEYTVTAANRDAEHLAAPQSAIDAWASEQMARMQALPLTEEQWSVALDNLGHLVDDTRPVYRISTSVGFLNLDELIAEIERRGGVILPLEEYEHFRQRKIRRFSVGLPRSGRNSFSREEISYLNFTLLPRGRAGFSVEVENGVLRPLLKAKAYRSAIDTIFNTLADRKCDFDILFRDDFCFGTYEGLSSEREGIRKGDEFRGKAIEVKLRSPTRRYDG